MATPSISNAASTGGGGGAAGSKTGAIKYPNAVRPGGSEFLRRRLEKGHKFFDSGDYNMAKAQEGKPGGGSGHGPGPILSGGFGSSNIGGGAAGAAAADSGGAAAGSSLHPSMQSGQNRNKQVSAKSLLPTIGDDNENPKPALSPDEIRTSKNSPPPKPSKLAMA